MKKLIFETKVLAMKVDFEHLSANELIMFRHVGRGEAGGCPPDFGPTLRHACSLYVDVFSQTCGLIGRQGRIIIFLIVTGQGKVKKHCKTYLFVNEVFVKVL